jgi:hypothetical protein
MSGIAVSAIVQEISGEKVAGAGQIVPLSNDTRLVRSVLITPKPNNTNLVYVGLSGDPKGVAPVALPVIDGKFYRLDRIRVKPTVANEGVDFTALF